MRRMTATVLAALALMSFARSPDDGPTHDEVDPDAVKTIWEYLARRYDADGDGRISMVEYRRGEAQFARLDKDKNGYIEEADTERGSRGRRGRRPPGDRKRVEPPQEGAVAPDFELELLYLPEKTAAPAEGGAERDAPKKDASREPGTVELSSLKGKKPVALIFGSYT